MKILGVGLSRTGTTSLAKALEILGFRTIHWEPERLVDVVMGLNDRPHWRRYDDVEAVTDLPAALFYRELLEAYPGTKCILTMRDESEWLRSVRTLFEVTIPRNFRNDNARMEETRRTQQFAYGSDKVTPLLYLKRYRDHNRLVQRDIPSEQLLTMQLEVNFSWGPLCSFLNVPVPNHPFPHRNRSAS